MPEAREAAMSAFSVAVTEASSRWNSVPLSPSGARKRYVRSATTSAPSASSASRWESTRRRPMTSPPGSGTSALPKRASNGPASRIDARMRSESPSSSDEGLSERIRASILLAGPLLARFGSADVPLPGGDVIGRRRVDSHLLALEALGADVVADRTYRFRAPDGLKGTEFHLYDDATTTTENALMAASLALGMTTIYHAACEPHVQDLCRLLVAMGVEIEGMGSNLLRVHGQAALGGASHVVCPDHIEVGSFIGMAAVTGGDVTITDCEPNDLRAT